MRVISGKARGARLFAPKGTKTRPTADFVKEALFNILAADIRDADFLDLFAGSGAIGIEAISRGARSCVFIDNNRDAIDAIRKNLDKTRLGADAEVVCANMQKALAGLNRQFDIIFADPPYNQNLAYPAINDISKYNLLAKNGIIVIEMAKSDTPDNPAELGFEIFKTKKYSSGQLIFFRHLEDAL
ncbi:MAG: 16S rRNA (guanine(966)-N(2))-methyltransferase RsmD [Defluviitaleaceae bacterium]|nr:16S rRNA (guanine(966)-N(2))-methyltransferase RsmD [Defluviitaleaceae bacterium]